MVDDPHRVGLGEADPDALRERIARRRRGTAQLTYALHRTILSADDAGRSASSKRQAIEFRVLEYERGESLRDFGREAAEALGLDHDQVFKTLIVTVDGNEVVAIVPVSCTVGLKAVGAALGAKRVEMCDPDACPAGHRIRARWDQPVRAEEAAADRRRRDERAVRHDLREWRQARCRRRGPHGRPDRR